MNKAPLDLRLPAKQQLDDKLLSALTILILILLFVLGPLQANEVLATSYFGLMFGLVLILAAFMLSANWIAAGLIVVSVVLVMVAAFRDFREPLDAYLDAIAWLIAGFTLSVVVALTVFSGGKVTFHRIVGGILLYLTIGLTFVALYAIVALGIPDAFKGLGDPQNFKVAGSLIYFSFVTLTTTGYGDIIPLHPYVRGLANVEAVIGQLYPATLLARLVTLQMSGNQRS